MTAWHPDTPTWYATTAERVCTPKQLEVLRLASHDLTDPQIAARLGITRQAARARRVLAHWNTENAIPPDQRRRIIEGAA